MNLLKSSSNGLARDNGSGRDFSPLLEEMLKNGLSLLWRSYEYTSDLDPEGWRFAVEIGALRQAGLSDIDLHWLIARGFVDFEQKKVPFGNQNHSCDTRPPFESNNARFVLTEAGAAFALAIISSTPQPLSQLSLMSGNVGHADEFLKATTVEARLDKKRPCWDRDRKELRCRELVIKQFRWAAVNQETILMAFEEEGWPTHIDDPLPQKLDQDPKCRLHDTIKCLNRNHKNRLMRFSGDGTGEGILWTFVNENSDP